jgi:hypothetical protein
MGSSSRHSWRLLIFVWAALLVGVMGAKADPVKTLVQDTLYRADGSAGHGTIAIHWSGFSTGEGESVAAGEMTYTTDANGGIAIPLIPNTGSTPAGSYYKVVIKMDDGTTSEELWVVPAVTTTTVAAIRAKVVPQAVAAQFVSRDYVDSLLSAQSLNPPVHLSGTETIQGTKTFVSSPEVPAPSDAGGAANKGYVDQVAGHGNVNFASPGPIGVTAPAAINATAITAQKSITSLSPTADIRAYGAACDGVSDDRAAFQAAINAVGAGGGSILIPGLGAGCYISNPTLLTWPSFTGSLAINVQGKIIFGSTFTALDWVDFVGHGGAEGTQFHSAGPTALIQGPSTIGTLGTNVSAGVQTFTPSTMTGIYAGAAITVVGQAACTMTSVSRTSNVVTATMSSTCHVAPGYYATVAGVSDNSYNGTFIISNSDYVLNTLSWQQTAGNSTSSGGTLAGANEDSIETAIVTATTASTATASFVNAHSAADQWGIVGVYVSGLGHHSLRDVTVSASGTGIWLYEAANVHLTGVSAGSSLGVTNQALEINESWWIYIRDSVFQNFTGTSSWGIRFTNTHLASSGDVAGLTYITDSNISGGIKLDRGTNYPQGNIYLSNTIIEQPTRGAFAVDTNMGVGVLNLALDKVLLQDNFHGYNPCFVSYLYPNATGSADIRNANNSGCIVNSYYNGAISLNGISGTPNFWANSGHGLVASNGRVTETELRGSGANLSPSLIPYATLPVTSTSTWTGNAGCTLTSGAVSPDGTADAITLTATGGGSYITPYGYAGTPAVGDAVIFGGWVDSPAGVVASGFSGLGSIGISSTNAPYIGFDQGAGTNVQASTSSFEMPIYGDWWHPVVGVAKIVSADGNPHSITLNAGCQPQGPISFWQPFMIYVPASAGIPFSEVERWRQQLLHGVVPAGMPGNVLGMLAQHKLYWGNDTDLYRVSANALQTDGSFNAAGGLINKGVPVLPQDTNSTVYSLSRALPTVAGTEVDLGSFAATATFDITYSMHGSGYDQGKRYFIPAFYNATGAAWQTVNPISASGAYYGNDANLEVNVNGNTVSFRLRRTGGTTAGTAQVTIVQHGSSAVFTPSTATSAVSAPTVSFGTITVQPLGAATSSQWVGYIDSLGVQHTSQPSFTDIGGSLAHSQLPTLVSADVPANAANTSGNAATATALAASGTTCSAGQAAAGVDASGNAKGCFTPSAGSSAFSTLTGGTNTGAAMLVGTGASLGTAGTGTITATNSTQVNGGALPVSKSIVGTNSAGQIVDATAATLTNNTSGTAANLSGTPALPSGTTATTQAPSDNSTKLATTAYVDAGGALKAGLTNPTLAGVTVGTSPLVVTTAGALSTPAVQISGAPVTGGSATTTAPLVNIGGGAAGNYSTSGTMLNVNAPSGFAGNLLCLQVNGGACLATVNSYGGISTAFTLSASHGSTGDIQAGNGGIQAKSFGGISSATLTAGAAAGTSPTIACATSHVCSAVNGTINLTTGSSPTTGALLTISSSGLTHTNQPDCQAQVTLTASPYTNPLGSTNPMFSYSTTVWTLNVGTALSASTAYTVTYTCLGY